MKRKLLVGLEILFILSVYFGISLLKVRAFNINPNFNSRKEGFFISESAFHYYFAKNIADGNKIPKVDYKIQYPEGLNISENITIFMEYFSGYIYRFVSQFKNISFRNFLVYFICFFSSLSALGVYLIGKNLTNSRFIVYYVTVFYAVSVNSFARTIGSYLREDFAFSFIIFSLYFFIKWLSKKRIIFMAISSLFMLIANISWHFTQFYLILFVLILLLIFNNKELAYQKHTILTFLILTLFLFISGIFVPILISKNFIFSFPMIILYFTLLYFLLINYFKAGFSEFHLYLLISLILVLYIFISKSNIESTLKSQI